MMTIKDIKKEHEDIKKRIRETVGKNICAKCHQTIDIGEEGTSSGSAYHCPLITGKSIRDKESYIELCKSCYPEFNKEYYVYRDWLLFNFIKDDHYSNIDNVAQDFYFLKEERHGK